MGITAACVCVLSANLRMVSACVLRCNEKGVRETPQSFYDHPVAHNLFNVLPSSLQACPYMSY